MPFSEELDDNKRKAIYEWARRIEIRGLRFGENVAAVVSFLDKIRFDDEKKGPGNVRWQQIYDLNNLEEKYQLYQIINFLENGGNEMLDSDLEGLKRVLLD